LGKLAFFINHVTTARLFVLNPRKRYWTRGNDRRCQEYKKNIRNYNGALAMVSTFVKCEEQTGGGQPFLKFMDRCIIASGDSIHNLK